MTESLYIHIPFCKSKCSYCDFFSVPGKSSNYMDSYVDALVNEMKFRMKQFEISYLKTVYIGGGTPSLLSDLELKKITDFLAPFIDEQTEFSIECNPDDLTEAKLSEYSISPINRISTGIQAIDDTVLKNVNRRSDSNKNINALELLSDKWNGEVSVDLICALPLQSEENFIKGLKKVLSYNVNHVSLYSLTFEENTPLYISYKKSDFDYDFEKADELWIKGRNLLNKEGFVHYEVSNFYNKDSGNPCKHNMAYWKLKNYAACGAAGTGSFYGKKSFRYTNTKNIDDYIKFWTSNEEFEKSYKNHEKVEDVEILTDEVLIFEFFMMGLRTLEGVSLDEFYNRFKIEIPSVIEKNMKKWCERGKAFYYFRGEEKFFALTEDGLLFLNQFLEEII